MITFKQLLMSLDENKEPHHGTMFHGSFSGDLRGGSSGIHLGTHEAARQALEARIGIRADRSEEHTLNSSHIQKSRMPSSA